ncbi:MAG: hypothetical protein IJ526_00465 [Lachnospiraceae bacterium]|nr:hypothetical protein [Lachnospiraceae bacterium]
MTKRDYINVMKRHTNGAEFITKKEICTLLNIKKPDHVAKYVEGLTRLSGKYYMIDEVADRMAAATE